MNETKKLFTILAVVIVFVCVVIVSVVANNAKGDKFMNKINEAFQSKEAKVVYLGRPTCGYCTLLKPTLDTYAEKYKFEYEYINTDEVGKSQLSEILGKFSLDSASFGTPYIAIVKDGKKVADQNGYVAEDKLFKFFQENGIIGKDEKLSLNYIDYNAYNEMINKGEKEIFMMVQTGCSHCEKAKPVLEEIAKEYNIKINVMNITDFKDDEEKNKFMSSLSYYNDNQWGTPLTLIVEDKKIINKIEGFESKEQYVKFFKDNGYIKE